MTELKVTVTEDSQTPETSTKAVLFHDVMERLCEIITGEKGRFYSETFGRTDLGYAQDGKYALNGITLGFWIRQFLDKAIETSVKEAVDSSKRYTFYVL